MSAHKRFEDELAKLSDCKMLAKKIEALRQRKQRALLQTKPAHELNRKIDSWAKAASIESVQIVRIQPREPRRIGDTQYLEQVIELELQETALSELVHFCQIAELNSEGLKLSSLRLSPSRNVVLDGDQVEVWGAELALTYLIYSPKSG